MVAAAFGDVQVAASLRAAMTAARMVVRLAARCRQARRRAHERRRLPLTPGSRRPACCGVRSEPDPLALARARCAEPSDGLNGAQARLWGRLFDVVDE